MSHAKRAAAKRGRRPRCPQCGGPLGGSTATITGGEVRVVGDRPGRSRALGAPRPEPGKAIKFVRLTWHRETAPVVTIVQPAVDLCSIACMRTFLTAQLDKLEKLSKEEEWRRRRTANDAKGLSIETPADYRRVLAEVETLVDLDPEPGSTAAARLDVIGPVLEAYEQEHFPIPAPSKKAIERFERERLGPPARRRKRAK